MKLHHRLIARDAAILALVIAVSAGMAQQGPAESSPPEQAPPIAETPALGEPQLGRDMRSAAAREDWPRAIEAGLKLVELRPERGPQSPLSRRLGAPMHAYNLACCYARAGGADDKENAGKWLIAAAKQGFPYPTTFQSDPDLESIRDTAAYREALKIVLERHQRDSEAFKAKIDATKPLIINPPDYDKKKAAPLIVALHGRGGTARPLAQIWRDAAAKVGAVIVAPNAPDPLGNGFQWTKLEDGEYIAMHAIEYAAKQRSIDRKRIILAGFSQGGYLSFVIAHRHPEALAGVVVVASSMERTITPPDFKLEHKPRYFIMIGADDPEADAARESHRLLLEAGFESELKIFEGLGHAMPPQATKELGAAFEWALKNEP